ncbi:hypothetical protein Vadar_033038 [Vaccinium darrowii]|uniref:Uncharacterized protein n=1 Tax=Vaccinium darrowii TaxID=229202 RepID=A0ACB7XMR1_9ERIC|nr:hypothetical protein Vadar_033038 [Vaccinium darrowii]
MKSLSATIRQRIGVHRHVSGPATWQLPLKKGPGITFTVLFVAVLVTATFFSSSWINSSSLFPIERVKEGRIFPISSDVSEETKEDTIVPILSDLPEGPEGTKEDIIIPKEEKKIPKRIEIPLNCSTTNPTQTCPSNYPTKMIETEINDDPSSNSMCPDYFRWIHEDLRPFKATGITRDMVERAKTTAHFRVVIVKGKVYVEKYKKSIQTRDVFTLWGILQLLRRYPGRLPDLELMFDCNDRPVIRSSDHRGPNATAPPPLFRYCGDQKTLDIVFPDWSFWGWAEINIRPWENILKDIKEGNKRIKWMDREPYAYWKGNPLVAETRKNLLTCNVSDKQDWNARLFVQDWILESQQGYKQSNVASQCTYRYKIYIEGWAWSVSEKYILACDSETLLVKPKFYDFFIRSLQPVHHYWPIRDDDKCRSLKFAVDWGNNHKQKAQAIGKAASDFIQEDLKMDYVYDYMFHLLSEYANLLKFEPKIPKGAVEFCSETMVCNAEGLEKKFMMESLVKGPSITNPCTLPPPYEPQALAAFLNRKSNSIKQVEKWERRYWENLDKKQ